ncbi:hypothetical protein U27_06397 [Candidatus Vecturithrix granuli]|uniref:Uncharacterized protein n=1 Tax=Vecturithrix granuli TaxID=1499967 RepID=A0A081C4A8_VECG1|nr:hypothetical protein U27_06397 [Candidatus Vecturithrix granuli]
MIHIQPNFNYPLSIGELGRNLIGVDRQNYGENA